MKSQAFPIFIRFTLHYTAQVFSWLVLINGFLNVQRRLYDAANTTLRTIANSTKATVLSDHNYFTDIPPSLSHLSTLSQE